MDKLDTYALVAALKGIAQTTAPQPPQEAVSQNERWISLRSCMTEMPNASLDPPKPAPPPEPKPEPVVQPLSTIRPQKSFRHLQAIHQRHNAANKQV